MRLKEYLKKFDKSYVREDEVEKLLKVVSEKCKPFIKDFKKQNRNNIDILWRGYHQNIQSFEIKDVRKDRLPKDTPKEVHQLIDEWFKEKFGIRARSETVFTSPKRSVALGYGGMRQVYAVFPIGNYEVIWSSKIDDLYSDLIEDNPINWIRNDNELEYIYNDRHSEGNQYDNGKWVFKNYVYYGSRYYEAVTDIIQQIETIEIDKDKQEELKDEIRDEIEFIPDMTLTEFEDDIINEFKDQLGNGNYKKGDLLNALKIKGEVMVYCDKYIMVNEEYLPRLLDFIYSNNQKQLTLSDYLKGKG